MLFEEYKHVDAFTALAEPTRRRILDRLRLGEQTVGDLVATLAISQPAASKHLKVLREAGFVSSRVAAPPTRSVVRSASTGSDMVSGTPP